MSDRVCLKCSGLSYADWRRGRNEAPPCQRCGRREVAVRVIRAAGGAEVASGEPVGRGMALHDRSTYPAVRSGSTKVLRCGRGLAGVTGGALGDRGGVFT